MIADKIVTDQDISKRKERKYSTIHIPVSNVTTAGASAGAAGVAEVSTAGVDGIVDGTDVLVVCETADGIADDSSPGEMPAEGGRGGVSSMAVSLLCE